MSSTIQSSYIPAQASSQSVSNNITLKNSEKQAAECIVDASASKDDAEDELELTPDSLRKKIAKGPFADLLGVEADAGGAIDIVDVRKGYADAMERFATKLKGLLNERGVDRSSEAVLCTDSAGAVRVSNDHPDREKIEAIFQENPDLANEFRGLSATASFLRAADESMKFQAAYAKDPKAAVAQFSYLFDNTDSKEFALRISQDAITPFFEDV